MSEQGKRIKNHYQTSIVFLYTSSEQFKNEFRKTILFKLKNIKKIEITNDFKDMYTEN